MCCCVAFALLSILGVWLLLERTRLGLAMRALASDRSISSLIGISAPKVDAMAWLISGAFAGLAGLFLADLVVMAPVPLTFLVIPATAAAVMGGLTSMTGAFVGGFVGGFCESALTAIPQFASIRSAAPYLIALVFITLFNRATGRRAPMSVLRALAGIAGGGDMSPTARFRQLVLMSVIFLVLALIIAALAGGFWLINLTAAYATMLALIGTNLLFGQLGLVSLCQFALVGVGGWVTLRIFHAFHPPFELSMLAGGVAASLVGVLWGLPALRFRGIYLALVTLMLAGAFQSVISAANFPSGGDGLLGTAAWKAGRACCSIARSTPIPTSPGSSMSSSSA